MDRGKPDSIVWHHGATVLAGFALHKPEPRLPNLKVGRNKGAEREVFDNKEILLVNSTMRFLRWYGYIFIHTRGKSDDCKNLARLCSTETCGRLCKAP